MQQGDVHLRSVCTISETLSAYAHIRANVLNVQLVHATGYLSIAVASLLAACINMACTAADQFIKKLHVT